MNEKEKKKQVKVSVIIPIYNAQAHLQEMLQTVVTQTLRDMEIICVDDGSQDSSMEIAERFRRKDSRIILRKEAHRNAGIARNTGLGMATGEYVVFWDADDLFRKDALEILAAKMDKTQADICVCQVNEIFENGKSFEADGYLKTEHLPKKEAFHRGDIPEDIFDFASNMLWNKMFRRAFIEEQKLQFQDIMQGNDTFFVMNSMYLAKRITCVDKRLVNYRLHNTQNLTSRSAETLFCPYESYLYTLKSLQKQPDFAKVARSFYNKCAKGMLRALNIQTSFDAYVKLYDFMQKEGLRELGLLDCAKQDFAEPWVYEDLQRICTMQAGEFLLLKTQERIRDRDQLKYTLRRVRRRLKLLLWVNEKVKKILRK